MSFPPIPPDNRQALGVGHLLDHQEISDFLTYAKGLLVNGKPYVRPLKSGWYYPLDGGGGNRTMTFNQLWLWPFDMEQANNFATLNIYVNTAGTAGTTIRVAVYSSDNAGGVGNLLIDGGTVAGDSTGEKSITGLNVFTNADRLWLGAVWQGTNSSAPVLQAYSRPVPALGWSSFVQFPSIVAYTWTAISGALPTTLGAPNGNENNNAPAVQFTVH